MTDRLERTLSDLRRKWVPDHRLGVFEVSVVEGGEGEGRKLVGVTTSREGLAAVQRLAAEAGVRVEGPRVAKHWRRYSASLPRRALGSRSQPFPRPRYETSLAPW